MLHSLFHSIKGKFLFTFFALIGVTLVFQFVYIAPTLQKRKIEEIKQSQIGFTRFLAKAIDARLVPAANELEAMAKLPGLVSLEKASMDETIATINASNQFFNYYFVIDRQGTWLSYPSRPDLVGQKIPAENMTWVHATFESGKTQFLDVIKSQVGTLVSGFSTPIVNQDDQTDALLRGVFVVSEKNVLVKAIENVRALKEEQAYLVASNGWLIAHSHQNLNYDQFASYSMMDNEPVKQALEGNQGILNYTFGRKEWIAAFQPIGMTSWGLIVQRPLENVISEAESDAKLIIVFILGCFLFGLVIAGLVVQNALRPLFRLVKNIQHGSIDGKSDYPHDEIGQLALQYRNLYNELYTSHELIKKSETKFRTFFNSTNDAIYIHDLEGNLLEINQKAIDYTGYSREELLRMKLTDIDAPASSRLAPSRIDELKRRRVLIFEATHKIKTGELVPVEISSRRIQFDQQDAILSIVRDLTERKKAEEALRESHQRFLAVLDGIEATIYVADMETHEILFMNKHMIESFGQDMIGRTCWDAFRCESGPCPHCTNDRLVDEKGAPEGVIVWQGKNPVTNKWYMNHDRAIKWIDGRTVRIQIATDITELKKLEEERKRFEEKLTQAQKMEALGTLAGGIAHDFNNLLMGIQGHVSLMTTAMDAPNPYSEHLEAIEVFIKSAADLTENLLGLSRGGKYDVKPVDINRLSAESAAMFGRTRKELRILTELCQPAAVVEADRRQIEQVLWNLFVNAWQAMPTGGEIYLRTASVNLNESFCKPYAVHPGQYALISVKDTGMGMDEATCKRIFEPFFTTKEKERGTGLGLASAYGIVQNHNGILTVDSKVGHGTTFDIFLPLSDKEACYELPADKSIVRGDETILLVDDEDMILNVGKAMLERLGYQCIIAKGGGQAIQLFGKKGTKIDLVILDLIMPGMDGETTFDQIRNLQKNLPVILSSGYSINDQAAAILKRGCNGFIQKPFNLSALSQIIRKVIDETKDAPHQHPHVH